MEPERDDDATRDDEMTRPLRDAIGTMREEPAISDLWRARVLGDVRRARAARRSLRRRGLTAAAVLLGVIAGSLLVRARLRDAGLPMATSAPHAVSPSMTSAPVRFTLVAPSARRVMLVGDFDAWTAQGRPMHRARDGRTWEVDIHLPPGRHAFAYMVDGSLRADPGAPRAVEDDFGVPSSVVVVAGGT